MSFKDTSTNDKLGILHLNELNNISVRFETLNNVQTDELAIINKEQAELQDILLQIKVNDMPLFIGVEQGSGKNQENVLLIITPKMKQDTRK